MHLLFGVPFGGPAEDEVVLPTEAEALKVFTRRSKHNSGGPTASSLRELLVCGLGVKLAHPPPRAPAHKTMRKRRDLVGHRGVVVGPMVGSRVPVRLTPPASLFMLVEPRSLKPSSRTCADDVLTVPALPIEVWRDMIWRRLPRWFRVCQLRATSRTWAAAIRADPDLWRFVALVHAKPSIAVLNDPMSRLPTQQGAFSALRCAHEGALPVLPEELLRCPDTRWIEVGR